ncbi:MAG: LysM peptidoglycan-binding domain-containing protein [Nitrococcus sp.]|nr:LysM peptidoglycan-binding domain-containing protein [Nitrococcus sp.]
MLKYMLAWALCALLILANPVAAAETPFKQGHPSQYTVQPGDSLWEISARFLKNPWYWPEIWYVNPAIRNPHLIYPGDMIKFITIDGKPRLVVQRHGGTIKLSPKVRVEELQKAVPTIPISALRPFLTGDRMVSAEQWRQAAHIVAAADEHVMGARGDTIFVRGFSRDEENRYSILRKREPLVDPESGAVLGYQATHVGEAVCKPGGEVATCIISRSNREVLPGDRLMRVEQEGLKGRFYPKPPARPINGVIVEVMGGVSQIGQYNVVAINRGEAQGLEAGDVLLVYKAGRQVVDRFNGRHDRVTLPDERAGSMIIFRTFPRMSFGLIMEATRAMSVYDLVRNPRASNAAMAAQQ